MFTTWPTFAGEKVEFHEQSDVHLAAVLIKLFLRELPQPLLTFESYDSITQLKGQLSRSSKLKQILVHYFWQLLIGDPVLRIFGCVLEEGRQACLSYQEGRNLLLYSSSKSDGLVCLLHVKIL